jgi:hypothetical protein
VAAAETRTWLELAFYEVQHSLFGSQSGVNRNRTNAAGLEFVGRPEAHASAQDSLAVVKGRNDSGVAVMLVVVVLAAVALALGVSGVRVVATLAAGNLAVNDIKHDKALAAAKMW